jgi:hypothetical protein
MKGKSNFAQSFPLHQDDTGPLDFSTLFVSLLRALDETSAQNTPCVCRQEGGLFAQDIFAHHALAVFP